MSQTEEIVYLQTEDIHPYLKNPRHNEKAIPYVANSIREFWFKVPIVVDESHTVICGHTRLAAAKSLGLEEVPCIIATDLTQEQVQAFRLADNKTAEIAEWDEELLQDELDDLTDIFDMSDFGFLEELEELVQEPEAYEDDYNPELRATPNAVLGDIYQLGEHRLMCGSSTDPEDVKKLIDGANMDITFTDPPYNIDYKGVNDDRKIKNDKMGDDDFVEFLEKSILPCQTAYVCCSWQKAHLFRLAMENIGMPPKAMIVWDKVNAAQHLDKYFKQHELIFYSGKFGGEVTIRGDIWQVKRQRNTMHPTMKPIELITMALNDNPNAMNVYDGFGGSGSTLIAAEQLHRRAYLMELDPRFVDVIIDRWQKMTGKKAKLLNEETNPNRSKNK